MTVERGTLPGLLAFEGKQMSTRIRAKGGRGAAIAIAALLAFAIIPVAAQASAVNLATVQPFVVLGATTVTNTGPSVLNGDLGVSTGTSLTGFGLPAVVNGATHNNDAVAAQAQSDLTTAYNVAAGQPVPPGNELTGQDLGGLVLTAGAYRYTSSAQLTGALTLDAQGDPNAQFVFEIGSTLTTASASSVLLVNGASPCNVYWQVGSSATLDSTTTFVGNLMALTDITLNNGASVNGRVLARTGQISLINNVLDNEGCATGSTPTPTPVPTPTPEGTPTTSPTPTPASVGVPVTSPGKRAPGKAVTPKPTHDGSADITRTPQNGGRVHATVTGSRIDKVTFSVDGKRVKGSGNSANVKGGPGNHTVTAHVTFKDATKPKTLRFRFHVPAPVLHPQRGSSQFTG